MVGHVEHFPAKLQTLPFRPRHLPALRQAEVHPEETLSPQIVPCARLARERFHELALRIRTGGEGIHNRGIGWIFECSGFHGASLVGVSGQVPVCWPLSAVEDAEGENRSEER